MDILIIHSNYPAQFRHLATGFGSNPDNRVVFLTARKDAETEPLRGVKIETFCTHREVSPQTHAYLRTTEEAVLQGQAVVRSLDRLLREQFNPNLVIFHGGNGLGLFIKDILPHAALVGYFEWWFLPETTKFLVSNFDMDTQLKSGVRNLPILQELNLCEAAVVPTEWQKQQFPKIYNKKLNVIFDGINTNFFHPPGKDIDEKPLYLKNRESGEQFSLSTNTKIISYATRGMEPLRGFPEFMNALPEVFMAIKNLEVVIAGIDRCAYSYQAPTHNGSWKLHLLEKLAGKLPLEKIHFTGLLNYEDYRSLLWRSDLHCYFTYPYVTSWSLFEAAACRSRLLCSKNEATAAVTKPETTYWLDLEDKRNISTTMIRILSQSRSNTKRCEAIKGSELNYCLEAWQKLLNEVLITRKLIK